MWLRTSQLKILGLKISNRRIDAELVLVPYITEDAILINCVLYIKRSTESYQLEI